VYVRVLEVLWDSADLVSEGQELAFFLGGGTMTLREATYCHSVTQRRNPLSVDDTLFLSGLTDLAEARLFGGLHMRMEDGAVVPQPYMRVDDTMPKQLDHLRGLIEIARSEGSER
jgi:hypothetical protein